MNRYTIAQLALTVPGMTTTDELVFLYELAERAAGNGWFVELGTYLGRTLTVLAFAAQAKTKRLLSIDDYRYNARYPDEHAAHPCSLAKVVANLTRLGFNPALRTGRIVLLEADTREKPAAPVIDQISLLFVDSDHFQAHFDCEMQTWLDSVVPGGIVACHDYNSPTWLEMTGAIDRWLKNPCYRQIGVARRLIGFEKLK